VKDLLEAGVHFGHQTKRWNPKMKPFIFGERNGIYIIDLGKTCQAVQGGRAVRQPARRRRTHGAVRRHQAAGPGRRLRGRAALRHVLHQRAVARRPADELHDHPEEPGAACATSRRWSTDGRYDSLSKKEIAKLEKEKKKLQKNLEGIRHMSSLPDALFVVDTSTNRSPSTRPAS
jgi:small subunit ribosomal protein S2